MIKKINLIIVTFFGIGYIKYAPGTAASIAACLVLYLIFRFGNLFFSFYIFLFIIFLFFYSLYAITDAQEKFVKKDPKQIVVDEVIGMSIPIYFFEYFLFFSSDTFDNLTYHPLGLHWTFYTSLLILFRFFDIYKPFPINWFDKKIKNSFGVLFDDILASVYTIITAALLLIVQEILFF